MFNVYKIKERPHKYGPQDTPVPVDMIEWEFNVILELFKDQRPKKVLEIGSWFGASLYHWIKNLDENSTIVALDNKHENAIMYPSWPEKHMTISLFVGNSRDENFKEKIKAMGPYNFIYLNGFHGYHDLKDDWDLAINCADSEGVIAIHQVGRNSRKEKGKFWREIQKAGFVTQELYAEFSTKGMGVVYL